MNFLKWFLIAVAIIVFAVFLFFGKTIDKKCQEKNTIKIVQPVEQPPPPVKTQEDSGQEEELKKKIAEIEGRLTQVQDCGNGWWCFPFQGEEYYQTESRFLLDHPDLKLVYKEEIWKGRINRKASTLTFFKEKEKRE